MKEKKSLSRIYEDAYIQDIKQTSISRLDIVLKLFNDGCQKSEQEKQKLIIQGLTVAYIDEWLAEINYFASYNLSKTNGKADFDPQFQSHEDEERQHREKIVNRLRQLNSPVPTVLIQEWLTRNSNGENWKQELQTNSLKILLNRYNEQLNAIKYYDAFLKFLKCTNDTTTYKLIREIKADEEEHAKDQRELLVQYGWEEPVK